MRVSLKLFVWLLIGLMAGQGPLLASAPCCHKSAADAQRGMPCCGAEMRCSAAPTGDGETIAARADGCPCLDRPTPLPARTPDTPAESGQPNVRADQPVAACDLPPANDRSCDSKRYSWPPGVPTSALVSIRVVVLLI
jgi:hypothetical protein